MSVTALKRGLILCLTVAGLAAVGCGSSDSPTSDFGSQTDPQFQEIQPVVNTFLDSVFVAFSAGLSSYNAVPIADGEIREFYSPGNPAFVVSSSSYEYTVSGWHHIIAEVTNNFVIVRVNDSIQFRSSSVIQESATDADYMDYRHHWFVATVDQTGDYSNFIGDVGIVFTMMNTSQTTLNGVYAYEITIHTDATSTDRVFEFTSAINNVKIDKPALGDWASGCPVSGNMTFTIDQTNTTVGSQTVTTTWTASVTFDSGMATVIVSNGSSTWGYSLDVCTPAI